MLYPIDFAHKNIHFVFHSLQEFANAVTDLCLSFSPPVLCIQTLVCSILKGVLIAIPLTCVWAYCPRCSRIISRVQSFSCWLDFGASRSGQVCLGPVLFRNLYVGTGWELSLKPKFKGIFFAHFFSLHTHFFQRRLSSSHKTEKYVKVRSKGKNPVPLLTKNAVGDGSAVLFAVLFSLQIFSS